MKGSSGAVVVRVGGLARGRPLLCSLRGLAETRFRRQAGVSLGLVGQLPGDLALTIARTWFEWKKIGRGVIEICMACNGHIVQASRKLAATLARVGPHDIFRRPRSHHRAPHITCNRQCLRRNRRTPTCRRRRHRMAAARITTPLQRPLSNHPSRLRFPPTFRHVGSKPPRIALAELHFFVVSSLGREPVARASLPRQLHVQRR